MEEKVLKHLSDELVFVRRFCYLNGFNRADLKDMVNSKLKHLDAYVLSAGSLKVLLTITAEEYKNEEYYIYEISSTKDYTQNLSDGSLATRDFDAIKKFFAMILKKNFGIVNELDKKQKSSVA